MRLEGQIKMGYYPTPPAIIDKLKSYLEFKGEYATLDPCCGCGTALAGLTHNTDVKTYGIELDEIRYQQAKEKLDKVAKGGFELTRISDSAFSLILLNPPYDYEEAYEDELRERKEKTFLIRSLPKLIRGGVLIYIIPQKRLTKDIARILSYKLEDIRVWRFEDKEYSAYNQIVVMGKRKKVSSIDNDVCADLIRSSLQGELLEELNYSDGFKYTVPVTPKCVPVFRSPIIDVEELSKKIQKSRLWDDLRRESDIGINELDVKPPLPLHMGHLCLLLASGMLDGEMGEGDELHLVKGNVIKNCITETDDDEKGEYLIEKEKVEITINLLTPQGDIFTLS